VEVNFSKHPKCLGLTARLEDRSSCPDTQDILARFEFSRQSKDSEDEYQEFKKCTEYQELGEEPGSSWRSGQEEASVKGERKWSVRDLLGVPWREVLHEKRSTSWRAR